MFKKIKGIGSQVATKANDAVDGIAASVKEGVDSLTSSAASMTDTLNEKAVRAATAQTCTILEIAIEELRSRPLSAHPVSLTATVNIGIAALELQVHLPRPNIEPSDDGKSRAPTTVDPKLP